jgi:hypothetical protein
MGFSEWAALVVGKSRDIFFKAAVNPGALGHLLRAENTDEVCLHPDLLCPSGYSLVDYGEIIHCPVCKAKVDVDVSLCTESCAGCHDSGADSIALPSSDGHGETLKELNRPCPYMMASASDDDPDVDSNGDDKLPCSPSWASLDIQNLAAQSMTSKSKFNGDALHDDRIRVHQGINRSVQLCGIDSQGRLIANPSADGFEICLPDIALELGHFSMELLPSMLLEQTALSSEVSDFQYRGVVELCDDFGDKQSWYYFEFAASNTKAAIASYEEGNAVSWLEPWQWRTMNGLRAAGQASCFSNLKTASDQRGFGADLLSSDEFKHAMGSSSEDDAAVGSYAISPGDDVLGLFKLVLFIG